MSKGEKRARENVRSLWNSPDIIINGRFRTLFSRALSNSTLPRSFTSHQPERWNARALSPEMGNRTKEERRRAKTRPRTNKKKECEFFFTEKEKESGEEKKKLDPQFFSFDPLSARLCSPPALRALSLSLLLLLSLLWPEPKRRRTNSQPALFLFFPNMHAVAAPEPTTTGLELGGAKAGAVVAEKKRPSKIASLRAAADLDDSADEEPCSTSSSQHPADPTLETCCHEPPPIALNPLNNWLFFGEKVLKLPIPPTNDIVVSLSFFFGFFFRLFVSRSPRKKKNKTCEVSRAGGFSRSFDPSVPLELG